MRRTIIERLFNSEIRGIHETISPSKSLSEVMDATVGTTKMGVKVNWMEVFGEIGNKNENLSLLKRRKVYRRSSNNCTEKEKKFSAAEER